MPTVRELTTRYDMKFDDRAFKKADSAIDGLTKAAQGLGIALGAAAIGSGFMKLVGLASDAEETINVLNESFERNSKAVQAWAATYAKDVGRSEFQMREMAGSLGAILNPMMDRNADAAAEMSTQLAGLAVDLASFFNTTDDDALTALKSAITGSSEPMRRYGVVLLESTLAQFALDQGIKKNIKTMTIAEKTRLRTNFILDQTIKAQGDAKRTSEGFANASKALNKGLKDLATRIGVKILPVVTRLTRGFRDGTRSFIEFARKSNIVEAALVVLGAVAVGVGVKMLFAFAGPLLVIAKVAAVVIGITLVVDDLITLFQGGKSVIGEFVDSIFGIGAAAATVQLLKDAYWGVVNAIASAMEWTDLFRSAVMNTLSEAFDGVKLFTSDVIVSFTDMFANITEGWTNMKNNAIQVILDIEKWLSDLIPQEVQDFLGIGRGGKTGKKESREDFFGRQRDLAEIKRQEAEKRRQEGHRKARQDLLADERRERERGQERGRRTERRRSIEAIQRREGVSSVRARLMFEDPVRRERVKAEGAAMQSLPRDNQGRTVRIAGGRGGSSQPAAVNQSNQFNMSIDTGGAKPNMSEMRKAGQAMSRDAASQQKRATLEALRQKASTP
jgi:hypothetical protein